MNLLAQGGDRLTAARPGRALHYLPASALVVDVAVLLAGGLVAAIARERLDIFDLEANVTETLGLAGPFMLLGWVFAIVALGGYRRNVFGAGTDEYLRVLNASFLAAGLVGVGCYLAKFPLSRGFFLLAFVIGIPALIVGRYLLRRALHQARRRGALLERVLIAGSPSHVDEVARVLRRESWLGYHVVGAVTPAHQQTEETSGGVPVLGSSDDVTAALAECRADVIFFAGGSTPSASHLRRIVWELEEQDVQVVVAPSVTDISSERVRIRPVGGLPLMHIDPPRTVDAARWGKRLFDLVGSVGLLILFAPLLVVAAIRIRLHDGGPVLFRQTRIGRRGEEFSCLKLRTMVTDAEQQLLALHAELNHGEGLFKMVNDPRVTKPGRWLRRYSLDELPQLVNVLRGEMSLVGPRPPLPLEVDRYDGDTARRLQVRPGMTGLWQVSGRSDLSWSEAIRLDLYYVDNWSMVQDLTILARTFRAVVVPRGAY